MPSCFQQVYVGFCIVASCHCSMPGRLLVLCHCCALCRVIVRARSLTAGLHALPSPRGVSVGACLPQMLRVPLYPQACRRPGQAALLLARAFTPCCFVTTIHTSALAHSVNITLSTTCCSVCTPHTCSCQLSSSTLAARLVASSVPSAAMHLLPWEVPRTAMLVLARHSLWVVLVSCTWLYEAVAVRHACAVIPQYN